MATWTNMPAFDFKTGTIKGANCNDPDINTCAKYCYGHPLSHMGFGSSGNSGIQVEDTLYALGIAEKFRRFVLMEYKINSNRLNVFAARGPLPTEEEEAKRREQMQGGGGYYDEEEEE